MEFIIERLRSVAAFRKDLPRFSSRTQQANHVAMLRDELDKTVAHLTLNEFFHAYDSRATPRARTSIPFSVTPRDAHAALSDTFLWLPPRKVVIEKNADGRISFQAIGRVWTFPSAVHPVFSTLIRNRRCSMRTICRALPRFKKANVDSFLAELVSQGLVAIVPRPKNK
jgi:hypothetical protein